MVFQKQDLSGVEIVHVHDRLVGSNGAAWVRPARVEDSGDGPGQHALIHGAVDNHLIVLAAACSKRIARSVNGGLARWFRARHSLELAHAAIVGTPSFTIPADVQHGLQLVWWVEIALFASEVPARNVVGP